MQMLRKAIEAIYTLGVMLVIAVATIIGLFVSQIVLIPGCFSLRLQSSIPRLWCRLVWFLFFPRIRIEGLENYRVEEPCIIVSNHQGHLDIPSMYRVFDGHIRMLAKAELFKIPVFGRAIRAIGHIAVERGDKSSGKASVEKMKSLLSKGVQIWLAPEGTRSRSGEIGEFKTGAFRMALQSGVPLQPVVIEGTKNMLPKGRIRVTLGQKVLVRVLPQVPPSAYPDGDYQRMSNDVRETMLRTLEELQERYEKE